MINQVSLAALVRDIKQKVDARETGTLFLKADDEHAYAVALQSGTITGVSSGLTVGNVAVEKLCSIESASYRFARTPFVPTGSKPEASYVEMLLGSGQSGANEANQTSFGEDRREFHQRAVATIKEHLLEVLGPIATHVLDEAVKSWSVGYIGADNLQLFLATLVREIDNEERSRRFMQRTISALAS